METKKAENPTPKRRRGFAAMDPNRQKEISSKGGKAAHEKGTAHEFTSDEARNAGRKGGIAISQNREHMARIGREGGKARGRHAEDTHQEQGQASEQTHHRPTGTEGLRALRPAPRGEAASSPLQSPRPAIARAVRRARAMHVSIGFTAGEPGKTPVSAT